MQGKNNAGVKKNLETLERACLLLKPQRGDTEAGFSTDVYGTNCQERGSKARGQHII